MINKLIKLKPLSDKSILTEMDDLLKKNAEK